jgi:glyoxylase-like metal-dependent hydrolase (beta-lactamase superfamily II)
MYVLDGGIIRCDWSLLTAGRHMGQLIDVPIPMYYIEVDNKKVVVDTGMTPECAEDPDKAWGPIAKVYKPIMKRENTLAGQLKKIGVNPTDIDYVIQTHLHLDHAGSTKECTKAEVLVQLNELRYAFWPDIFQKLAYIKGDVIIPDIKYHPIEGGLSLFDGKIEIVPTPGHTPGHQSVIIRLPKSGSFIITGDEVYMKENWEQMVLPGLGWSPVETIKSMEKLKEIAKKENAKVLYGHDPELWKELLKVPKYYE